MFHDGFLNRLQAIANLEDSARVPGNVGGFFIVGDTWYVVRRVELESRDSCLRCTSHIHFSTER